MDDELLADILAAEHDIRLQIESLEQQTAARLASFRQEFEQLLAAEAEALQAELELDRARAGQAAEEEAQGVLAEARAYAGRLKNLDNAQLERVVRHHLPRIYPEGADDRQDEQA